MLVTLKLDEPNELGDTLEVLHVDNSKVHEVFSGSQKLLKVVMIEIAWDAVTFNFEWMFPHIPRMYNGKHSTRYFGDMAKFILANWP